MLPANANVLTLAGGLRVKARVQHPQVKPRKDREAGPWVFRYWSDEIQPDGTVKTLRKYQSVGLSKGDGAITKKQAEIERDKFLARLNAPTVETAVQQVAATGVALFGAVAKMYEDGYLGRRQQIAKPTRVKEEFYLRQYIVPKWGALRLIQIQPKAVEDWLHTTFDSWWAMHGVRAIMSRVYHYAEGHGLWEEGKRNPPSRARIGKKRYKRERKILSFDETARVLERLEEPYKLIIETCIATGGRISEVLGLQWRHVGLEAGTVQIDQRVWHQEVGRPKSEGSRRPLGIGDLVPRYQAKVATEGADARRLRLPAESARRADRSGILECVMLFTKRRKKKTAISRAWDRTHSVEPTSLGGRRSAAARSTLPRLPAMVTLKQRVNIRSSRLSGRTN